MPRKRIDLTGQTFGDLKVVGLSDKRGTNNTRLWECKCTCENTTYVLGISLRAGYYTSCGCKHDAKRDKGLVEHIARDRVDGTRKSALKAKLHKGNKSGHKGVRWVESRQKWNANIGFKGKQINLGYYTTKEDAIASRQAGEEKYHRPYLEDENE
ncbi:HNH endonuclease [Paenibacillus sp. M1]|uniref:HNH endonuclease n=1 Tax=Paenibacillus haidiansis TaxID=1574488 RepID=A0ABU7VMQ1_9BACL